ncbi:hypothetical protein [Kineococcus indalonis]|uniref:hypothetical protein n=1 Tax=Kineococcus indalonis TaxID=2696566 RepID=UPI00141255C4|nr:hypothetical protein [Kineococcus indalonis]NAZ84636.1 hypothetical protein [Kineococcus indalonis]
MPTPQLTMPELTIGQRVRVHVNLHKQALAVADPSTGKVLGYVEAITLTHVTFRTQAACLDRVQRDGVRKVCAYAVGTLASIEPDVDRSLPVVTFNPHRRRDFHDVATGASITGADAVTFADLRCYVIGAH